MRNTTLALFMAVGASILLSSSTDAAPISRSSSQTKHQQDEETLIVGRIQIKSRSRHPASSPSASSSSSSSSSHKHKHKHNKKKSITHHASKFDKFLISDPELSGSTWYPAQHRNGARALVPEGHAVVDDEDDDAGNELLDTELESGLERPDDDDTIEGEVLEEEDLDEFDAIALDYGDDEGVEGHLLQHTLRAANTAANVARAKAAAMAAAARARAVESLDWLKEFEDAEAEEEEVVKVVLSRFGGRAAAADMAAQAGEV